MSQALDQRPLAPAPVAPSAPAPAPEPAASKAHRRHLLRGAIGVLVSVVSLGAVIAWALRQGKPHFPASPGHLALVGCAVALYALATVIRGWRWHRVLRQAGIAHRPADAYALVPVGYMGNTVLPARGGEVLRILLMGERTDARRRTLLGTVLSERTLDAATLVLLLSALTLVGVAGNPAGAAPAIGGMAALVVGGVAVWLYLRLRIRGHFQRLADLVRPVVGAARPLLGRPGLVLGGATIVAWSLESVIFWLIGSALSLHIGLFDGALLLVLTAFFSLIPAAPGYVGTFDAAVVFGLKALDVTGGAAVSYALLVRFVLFFPVTVAGLGLLIGRYGGLRQLWKPREIE